MGELPDTKNESQDLNIELLGESQQATNNIQGQACAQGKSALQSGSNLGSNGVSGCYLSSLLVAGQRMNLGKARK